MKLLVFGATSTIAQEVQKIYATQKAEMWLVGRNQSSLEAIQKDLQVRGAKVHIVLKDLLDYKEADQFVDQLWHQAGGFDVCFMAQGVLGSQRADEKSVIATLDILNANLTSHIAFLTPIANFMEQAGRGRIGVITSVAGDRGKQSNYIYCAAKAGKIAFLSGLRNRLFAKNVSVTELRLGFVDSAMTAEFKKGLLWAKAPAVAEKIVNSIQNGSDIVYIPFFWKFIMMIIKSIPEFVFKKLKL